MIQLNQTEKLPTNKFILYVLLKIFLVLIIFYFIFSIFKIQWFIVFISIFFVPFIIYIYLYTNSVAFIINDDKITKKSGVIFKKSKIIPYSNIQSINIDYGLLRRLIGLATINIWTSSQNQIDSKGAVPDGRLTLLKEDVEWISNFIASKDKDKIKEPLN